MSQGHPRQYDLAYHASKRSSFRKLNDRSPSGLLDGGLLDRGLLSPYNVLRRNDPTGQTLPHEEDFATFSYAQRCQTTRFLVDNSSGTILS